MKKAISWISGALFIWMFLIDVAEPNTRAIKSIKADDGDIIDCINIYQQPAFNNPRLKNHTIIKTRSGNLPFSKRTKTARQAWQNNGRCPDGTIAVRRATQQSQLEVDAAQPNSCSIEFAGIQAPQTVYGARGDVNVWGIRVEPNEWSTNGIAITNGHGASLQFGWMVAPTLYGESHGKTRLFIRTVDPHNGVDCFNLNCAGFVQISNEFAFGAALAPLSQYGDVQYETHLTIYKDMLSNRWCAMYGDTMLGYWPLEAFPAFDKGEEAFWGGQVCNMHEGQEYTTTGMGSGYYPIEGMGKSAYIHGIQVMQIDKSWQRPIRTFGNMSNQPCYGVEPYESKDGALSIFFGGTANMACCGLACQGQGPGK